MNANATTVSAAGKRDALQRQISELATQRQRHEAASRELATEISVIDQHAAKLKLALAQGADASSTSRALDDLDKRRTDLNRKREGLSSLIATVDRQLTPLHAQMAEAARLAAEERQRQELATIERQMLELADRLFSEWASACRNAYFLMDLVHRATASNEFGLNEDGRAVVLAVLSRINSKIGREAARVANERWHLAGAHRFRPDLMIAPALPPATEKTN